MNVSELIKEIDFTNVKRELVLSDRAYMGKLSDFDTYFESLKLQGVKKTSTPYQICMNRVSFETAFIQSKNKEFDVNQLKEFISVDEVLSSEVKDDDVTDLEKELIIAGILCYLTFNGTCFNEDERKTETDRVKAGIDSFLEGVE